VGGAIKEIQAGRLMFAIDQQQYLQGYLPVTFAVLYVTNLNTVGNGQPVLTGPGIINKSNATQIAKLASEGTR
jgi:simple sugar transport system substrate-binding protein